MTAYEENALVELERWKSAMQRSPSLANQLTKKLQHKVNSYIPEKVHQVITTTIKQMIRAVLFGAEKITQQPLLHSPLELREKLVRDRIRFYNKAAAAEGGVTGAGGILLGFADFPLLLGLKLKLLYDIAAFYGYSLKDYKERLYLLHIMQLAFSSQEQRNHVYVQMIDWESQKEYLPDDIHAFDWRTFQQEYRDYIDLPKLVQLIPVVGAPIGAVVNYKLINKLGETAMNAYRLRWQEEQRQRLG
ncbi:EcsC family protein [Pontibacter sp. SGAir0037]|uniref:EcsC family protein n=1 Tax=Pontibacter sp. SGAir0037 TaxID=2571030 RepID=UPI0010CCEA46|nr:EcsC family protein [Pontibacter sp. SGAir0037]QCR22683.1 ABC transporter-associated protein EcsC [Pontibacter sp. SGAir0037]